AGLRGGGGGAGRAGVGRQPAHARLQGGVGVGGPGTARSAVGAAFPLGEMRRLGVTERGVMEVLGVTQMFSSYTKIADTLQLEPDMGDIAPPDWSPAPGGAAPPAPTRPPEAP